MPKPKHRDERSLIPLLEEATELLRRVPARDWVWWFAGTAPLVCALLHFTADMSRAATARDRLMSGALIVALTYWLMKVAQAVFADRLLRQLRMEVAPPPLNFRGRLRLLTSQAVIHASAPWMLILTLTAMLPFGWAYAFYHNVSVLTLTQLRAGGRVRDIFRASLRQAHYRQGVNHGLMIALLLVAVLAWFNLMAGSLMVAMLLKSITGDENTLSRYPLLILSTGSLAASIGITYLLVGPLVKAAYAVRCFYSLSRHNGEDIAVGFRLAAPRVSVLAALAAAVFFQLAATAPSYAVSQAGASTAAERAAPPPPPSVEAPKLDQALQEVLSQDAFQWRLPRGQDAAEEEPDGWLEQMMKDFGNWMESVRKDMMDSLERGIIGKIKDWLRGKGEDEPLELKQNPSDGAWVSSLQGVLKGLLVLLALALVWMLIKHWQRQPPKAVATAAPAAPAVNLESEQVMASQLPENEWLKLAQEKMESGDYRLAMRALFLATLAHLGERRLIAIARSKSNGDYLRELGYRARDNEGLRGWFADSVRVFDRAWYGWHDVSRELLEQFRSNHQRIVSNG